MIHKKSHESHRLQINLLLISDGIPLVRSMIDCDLQNKKNCKLLGVYLIPCCSIHFPKKQVKN